jgi:hypothetical protein
MKNDLIAMYQRIAPLPPSPARRAAVLAFARRDVENAKTQPPQLQACADYYALALGYGDQRYIDGLVKNGHRLEDDVAGVHMPSALYKIFSTRHSARAFYWLVTLTEDGAIAEDLDGIRWRLAKQYPMDTGRYLRGQYGNLQEAVRHARTDHVLLDFSNKVAAACRENLAQCTQVSRQPAKNADDAFTKRFLAAIAHGPRLKFER